MKTAIIFSLILVPCIQTFSQVETNQPVQNKMEWFEDAKLGIFIHYGIYAVLTSKHHDGVAFGIPNLAI